MRSILALSLVATILGAPGVFAQPTARRFTIDEMLKLRRVSDPQLSPDGKRVAYVVMDVNLERNTRNNDIWVAPLAGGAPVQLTRSDQSDDRPRWSPD